MGWGGGDCVWVCVARKHVVEEGRDGCVSAPSLCSSAPLVLGSRSTPSSQSSTSSPACRAASRSPRMPASLPFFPCVSQRPCPPVFVFPACAVRGERDASCGMERRCRRTLSTISRASNMSSAWLRSPLPSPTPFISLFPSLPSPPPLFARVPSFPCSPLSRILFV